MVQIILLGLGAGAAAALMFASVASGALLSVVLFYLVPLPIMVAALGWSYWTGLFAVVCAAGMLGLGFGVNFFAAFLAGVGTPAWWLSYLALLARPATNGHSSLGSAPSSATPVPSASPMEWYPLGRLVLWAAFLGAAVVATALLTLGGDEDTIRAGLKSAIERILGAAMSGEDSQVGADDTGRVLDLFVIALPPVAAVIATLTQVCNLWLAARIAMVSGRLKRPWTDLAGMSFPPAAAAALAIATALSFLPGLVGLMATPFAATLTLAFAILGFAVMHAATRGMNARPVILAGLYGVVAAMGWPVLIMTLIGIGETIFRLRARRGLGSPPAAPAA